MECIYSENLTEESDFIDIGGSEAKHLHVLRMQAGKTINISNGKGLLADAIIENCTKKTFRCQILNTFENKGELPNRLDIAFGKLSDRNRQEFLIEKCTELGVTNFFPLITEHSQQNRINMSRLNNKALSAMKQSRRSVLPKLFEPVKLNDLLNKMSDHDNIIITDENGKSPENTTINGSTLIFVGPEGGFSNIEIELLLGFNPILWDLGNRRLRAETAAIIAAGIASMKNL